MGAAAARVAKPKESERNAMSDWFRSFFMPKSSAETQTFLRIGRPGKFRLMGKAA